MVRATSVFENPWTNLMKERDWDDGTFKVQTFLRVSSSDLNESHSFGRRHRRELSLLWRDELSDMTLTVRSVYHLKIREMATPGTTNLPPTAATPVSAVGSSSAAASALTAMSSRKVFASHF